MEKYQLSEETNELLQDNSELILHNDDYNTFDWVIQTLIEVCDHDPLQAEQCAYIVHYNGKCSVDKGSPSVLKPKFSEMQNRDLTVTLE